MHAASSSAEVVHLWSDETDRWCNSEDGEAEGEATPQPCFRYSLPRILLLALLLAALTLATVARPRSSPKVWFSGVLQDLLGRAVVGALELETPSLHMGSNGSRRIKVLMPWHEAQKKAKKVVEKLTTHQIRSLVHGVDQQGPGFYIGNVGPVIQGVPPLKMQDASSGFRNLNPHARGSTTQWPCLLALASTFDENLVGDVASAIGREFLGKGANVLLGPAVNVHRSAYGGRNFEYLSGEDPYLGARLARSYITALHNEGVMAVVKHFAFNEQETARGHESSDVDERTAWELYYPPFEAAIEAGAAAVMCSYNQVNGTSACENEALLRRDLKGKMAFQGFVVSDWTATHSTEALKKGLDMEQPHGKWFSDQKLDRDVPSVAVQDAAVRVLSAIFRLRLDEEPGCVPPCRNELLSDQRSKAHLDLAKQAATRSVTLLKNDGVLPLDTSRVRKLVVLGLAAAEQDVMKEWSSSPYAGGGSSHVLAPEVVTPFAAISERAERDGVEVISAIDDDLVNATVKVLEADVAIIVAAAHSTEGHDRQTLDLSWEADDLIEEVAKICPTVVLLQTPGAVLTPWREGVSAIANLFYGGEQTGWAWAAVLFGDHVPTGKLPIMFPASEEDTIEPAWANPPFHYYSVPYVEGLSTSYRSGLFRSAFPFGHGLSYTTFRFDQPLVRVGNRCLQGVVCLVVVITNTGRRAGSEVAQAYMEFLGNLEEPHMLLRGFQRTRLLQPGEYEELLLPFTARDLSTYNPVGGWSIQPDVRVHVGVSSGEILHVVNLPSCLAFARPSGLWWFTILSLSLTLLHLR